LDEGGIHATIATCEAFREAGYSEEVERFAAALPQDTPAGGLPVDRIRTGLEAIAVQGWFDAKANEPLKWVASLDCWQRYRDAGEDAALEGLPFLFELDCEFFLRQRWIAELLGRWRQQRPALLPKVLLGTPKRGVTSYEQARKTEERDLRIYAEIERLRDSGMSIEKAVADVADRSHEVAGEKLAEETVSKIRKRRKRGETPLERLLSPKSGCGNR
jgi:hypothetical protein